MRLADLLDLPPVLSTEQMAEVTVTDKKFWWAVARHEVEAPFEITPIRVGRTLRWPTAPVLRALGIEVSGDTVAEVARPALLLVAPDTASRSSTG